MASALKNLIDKKFVVSLARNIRNVDPKFKDKEFSTDVLTSDWSALELKQRVRKISSTLNRFLPGDYPHQVATLKKVIREFDGGLGSLLFPDFVEIHSESHIENHEESHWDTSIEALKYFTPFISSEFAIRPFIKKDPKKMLAIMQKWSKDSDHHVRRLSSEGFRPRLPWSFRLDEFIKNPKQVIAILENLKNDESLYVRKSVANHLNDITKDHPELVLELAKKWIGKSENTDWILKHGLRTLLKRGDQRALKIFGLTKTDKAKVGSVKMSQQKNRIGSQIEFTFRLKNESPGQVLRLEYAIHYLKKNDSHNKKVFKIAEKSFSSGEHVITKKHSLRQMTTRKHHPGDHKLDVIVNGETKASTKFVVIK